MKTLSPSIFQFMGYLTNGDFADLTFYTSQRHRLVFFLKTWPKDPPTYNQTLNRNRWRHAAIRWRALDQAVRDDWFEIARRVNATVTGFNLYMYYILNKNVRTIETLERQSGINIIARTGDPLPYPIA